MLPARPHLPTQPCPACGRGVDPLRAARAVWIQDGARFLCSAECRTRFLRGEREFDSPPRPHSERARVERPSIPDLVREATVVRGDIEEGTRKDGHTRPHDPAIAMGLAVVALAAVVLTSRPELGWLAASLLIMCAGVNARVPLATLRATPSLRVAAPLGVALATLAAVLTSDPERSAGPSAVLQSPRLRFPLATGCTRR